MLARYPFPRTANTRTRCGVPPVSFKYDDGADNNNDEIREFITRIAGKKKKKCKPARTGARDGRDDK